MRIFLSIVFSVSIHAGAIAQENPTTRPELPRLKKPVVLEAAGQPIACMTGHAAPFVVDVDGDKKKDLVVGEYGDGSTGGRAKIYLNVGTDAAPRFERFTYLQAGGGDATVPSN